MTQQQLDARDRRWASALLLAGMSPEEAARMIGRPREFVDGVSCAGDEASAPAAHAA